MSVEMSLAVIETFLIAHPLVYFLILLLISAILTVIMKKLDFWEAVAVMTLVIYIIDYASHRAGVTLIRLLYEFWEVIIKYFCNVF